MRVQILTASQSPRLRLAGVRAGLLVLAIGLVAGCDSQEEPEVVPPPDPALGPVPVLYNIGLDPDEAFDVAWVNRTRRMFFEFGFEVIDGEGNPKALPHFSYGVPSTTKIISPMRGYVDRIHGQSTEREDYALWLKPRGDTTSWLVEIDHIRDLAVEEGDLVEVGDLLGYPVGTRELQGFELMVNGPESHVCPFSVFDEDAASDIQSQLQRFMVDWDAAKWALPEDDPYHPAHSSNFHWPYDVEAMVVPGCNSWTMAYGN